MVLADHVYQDQLTGKFIIAGTFSQLMMHVPKETGDQDPTAIPDQAETTGHLGPVTVAGSPYLDWLSSRFTAKSNST